MLCLWPSSRSNPAFQRPGAKRLPLRADGRLTQFALSAVIALLPLLGASLAFPAALVPGGRSAAAALAQAERSLWRVSAHISEFGPISSPLALPRCGRVRPPEALLTPDPLLPLDDDKLPVRVSFIVGSDGHVHSAFVLTSGGNDEDRAVLRTVLQWRYRPALCNGVPTDYEARVRFSIQ